MKPFPGLAAPASRQLAPLRSEIVRRDALVELASGELDQLAQRCAAPATARGSWLAATVRAVPDSDSWGVVVRDGEGSVRAAAVLLDLPNNGGYDAVSLAGCATGHRSAVLADSPASAALLGHAVGETILTRDRSSTMVLGPIDSAAPWLGDFAATIPGAEVAEVDPIPAVRRAESTDASDYLGASMRRTLRKAANRLRADGGQTSIRFTRDSAEIAAMLPALMDVHRARNHGQGRTSELDDPVGRRIWNGRIVGLASDGTLEVSTLSIDGRLAAQVIALVEPTTYRVLEGFMVTEYSRYAAGRLLEAAVLQRFLDDAALQRLDWMTAVAPESLLAANELQPVSVVRAAW
jgi:CelD/BcsL family acetyltransferase involved in cellulose biosynthesis